MELFETRSTKGSLWWLRNWSTPHTRKGWECCNCLVWREVISGWMLSMDINPWRKDVKKRTMGSFQWWPVTEKRQQVQRGGAVWTSRNTFLLWQWLSIDTGCGICDLWWIYSNPPRHYVEKLTVGDPSLAQGLDQRTSKNPFQHQPFCDSVKEFKIMLSSGDGNTKWNKMPFKKNPSEDPVSDADITFALANALQISCC